MDLIMAAARNNADWCQAMCTAHDRPGEFTAKAWFNSRRSPMYYPDAVTLTPQTTAAEALSGIDDSAGASVKDSFATLDLTKAGYRTIIEAQWIHRPAGPGGPHEDPQERWERITDPDTLALWEQSWGGDDDPAPLFVPALLSDPQVAVVVGRRDDRLVGGAVLNRSAEAVGVSNVFDRRGRLDATWRSVVSVAGEFAPGLPLVGYEEAGDLDVPLETGFATVGPLKVWWRRS